MKRLHARARERSTAQLSRMLRSPEAAVAAHRGPERPADVAMGQREEGRGQAQARGQIKGHEGGCKEAGVAF